MIFSQKTRGYSKCPGSICHIESLLLDYKEEIILGVHENALSSFYNSVLIIGKQYIYASRCLKKKPCIKVLINKIKFERKLEYFSAIQNEKLQEWGRKWILFESLDID